MIKSVSYNQTEILKSIIELHIPDKKIHADIPYGSGCFYKDIERPSICMDINPKFDFVVETDSNLLPFCNDSLNSIVFDPPFLCHIKKTNTSIMGKRFSGYWTYSELETHYKQTLEQCHRALVKRGILIFKCQDIIHNHKMHSTHASVIQWATERGFRLKDLFVLAATHRIPVKAAAHGRQTQQHARIYHSYFLVFIKK